MLRMLRDEVKKVIAQICGRQNIFGYRSTVANQMYLLYCICGNIYFTDKVDKRVKYLWYILISIQLTISYISALWYFLFEEEYNIVKMLFAVNVVGVINMTNFGFTLICYICADQMEAIIERVDRILTTDRVANSRKSRIISDMKNNICAQFMVFYFVCIMIAMFICCFDVVLFFCEDKVKNYLFYTSAIPLIRQYGSLKLLLCYNGVLNYAIFIVVLQTFSFFSFMLYWDRVCSTELGDIADEIYYLSGYLTENLNKSTRTNREFDDWNKTFNLRLKPYIRRFQGIVILINDFRMFVEVMGAFLTASAFFFSVVMLSICSTAELNFALQLKYVSAVLASTVAAFLVYWIGQDLEDSIMEVSTAIYSTPWYCSVKARKNIHIFLSQTQQTRNLAIIKVYGLLLNNFARYLHAVMSYTNVLRRLAQK